MNFTFEEAKKVVEESESCRTIKSIEHNIQSFPFEHESIKITLKKEFAFYGMKDQSREYDDIRSIKDDLHDINVVDYLLYYDNWNKKERTDNDIFDRKDEKVNKFERHLNFNNFHMKKFTDGQDIIRVLKHFIEENGNFPFKTQPLRKSLDYANKTGFLSKEEIEEIESVRNSQITIYANSCFNKVISFIGENKRWIYETEKEMYKKFSFVMKSFMYRAYTDEQISNIDMLYKKYHGNESIGEMLVNSYLVSIGIEINKQYKFADCVDKRELPFDVMFYYNNEQYIIEFDGRQHYEPVEHFGGNESFNRTVLHDSIKNNYCENNNIRLLRIRYDEVERLQETINDFLKIK